MTAEVCPASANLNKPDFTECHMCSVLDSYAVMV